MFTAPSEYDGGHLVHAVLAKQEELLRLRNVAYVCTWMYVLLCTAPCVRHGGLPTIREGLDIVSTMEIKVLLLL